MSALRRTDQLGSPATEVQVAQAEAELSYRLPTVFKELLREHNGGYLEKTCYRTTFPNSYAKDHVAVDVLCGVGEDAYFCVDGPTGSAYMIAEWGYPDVGVVIFSTPAGGHDTVMLDYRACGPQGEPSVVYVDEERIPIPLATNLEDFMSALEAEDAFDF